MASLGLDITYPRGLTFELWAALLTEALAVYNVPRAVEGEWFNWARVLISAPTLAGLGLPDPREFADWERWAEQLVQALNS